MRSVQNRNNEIALPDTRAKMPNIPPQRTPKTSLFGLFIRKLVFPIWVRRDHPQFPRFYAEFDRTQFLPKGELQTLQLNRLRSLLRYAKENCPFYAERMLQAGFDPDKLTRTEQLTELPVTTKRDIQDYGPAMLANAFRKEDRVRNQTGGSTGSPLQFYVDRQRFDSRKASTVRHNLWAGIQTGDWQVYLWGSRLDEGRPNSLWDHLRNRLLYRTILLNTAKISDSDWSNLVREIRAKKPSSMIAYAQSAVLFARYLRGQGIQDIQIPSIVTTAEMLLPGQREFLEETFRGKVFNRYGSREVSVIASECEFHRGMHVNADALLLEIVPDPKRPGRSGRILITDLLNYSMPLIRYEIGDVGQWAEEQRCPCGRNLPLLADVQGRITDFLVLADGREISGPALTLVISDMADVRQIQFVQRAQDQVLLRVVPGNGYGNRTEEELRRRLSLYLGKAARLHVELTDSIASETSGKYRFVIHDPSPSEDKLTVATGETASKCVL
jgi:phenylacetate-CoA ligase